MWIRSNLKENAKIAFKRNYWKCVLVAFILGIVTGAGSGAANSVTSNTTINSPQTIIEEEIYGEDYSGYGDFEEDYFTEDYSFASGITDVFTTTVIVIIVLIIIVVAFVFQLFLAGPLEAGCCNFFKNNAYEKSELNRLTFAFSKEHYWKIAVTMFLRNLFTAFWTLLLIVPGLIKSYEYRMIPYILSDCPDMSRQDAFRISKEMMKGNKWDAFILDLSFFGWAIVATITCGLAGVFYVKPYIAATDAELFIAIREEYFRNQRGE